MDHSAAPSGEIESDDIDLTASWSERDILAEAQTLGHTGAWAWQVGTRRMWWSDEMYRIFGLEPQAFPATYDQLLVQCPSR